MAICPYCNNPVTSYNWNLVTADPLQKMRPKLDCVEISCPHCSRVISVIYNPDRQAELIASALQRR